MPDINVTIGGPWVLTYSDEFNGAANDPPDSAKWVNPSTENDFPKWDSKFMSDDAYLDGNSNLVLRAQQRSSGGASYTSGQISTEGKFSQTGGRWEARIQMPAGGSGIWPAYWTLGANWPTGGEIDILESFADTSKASAFYHYNSGGHQFFGGQVATGLSGFHTYAAEWDSGTEVRWYLDGVLDQTYTSVNVVSTPMWIQLDIYIGGPAGSPSGTTFPQYMLVDYVRVYRRA